MPRPDAPRPDALVMVCDVDLGRADATRVHTVEVARWFAGEGLAVDLVARGPDPALEGVRYHAAAPGELGALARPFAVNRRAIRVLRERKHGVRTAYVRHSWALVPTLLAAKRLGYRITTQVDDVAYGPGFERRPGVAPLVGDYARRFAARVMARAASSVVAVGEGIKTLLSTHFGVPAERITVIPNGVDPDLFAPVPREEAISRTGLDPDGQYVVFTGLLAEWVAVETMVRAFAEAAETRPRARLLLVGDGPGRELVERLGAELGVAERIELTGFVADRARVSDLVAAATVCLVAYKAEFRARTAATPVKLPEYLAAGRAVVGIGMPGISEMIEENDAGVTVPNDPHALAEAIGALLDDPARADELGANGRRAAVERHSWRSVVQRTIELL